MRQFIISEERLKMFLRHEKELVYVYKYPGCWISDEESEITEDDLKPFTEIKDHEYVPNIDKEFSNNLKKIINKFKENND